MAYASPSPEWAQFLATDIDRNGEVSAMEMQQMLAMAGLVFSLQTVMKLITLHSHRELGTLDFGEFQNVQSFLQNIQASFQYFDQTRTGRLNKSEVLAALRHAGFGHVDQGAVKSSCQAFDPDRTNALSLDQYIAMTLFLLSAKVRILFPKSRHTVCPYTRLTLSFISQRAFDAFDATQPGSGRITLDFNQFVYAASKTR
jgi:Ca2+-binding EF-hand superfamily protein